MGGRTGSGIAVSFVHIGSCTSDRHHLVEICYLYVMQSYVQENCKNRVRLCLVGSRSARRSSRAAVFFTIATLNFGEYERKQGKDPEAKAFQLRLLIDRPSYRNSIYSGYNDTSCLPTYRGYRQTAARSSEDDM